MGEEGFPGEVEISSYYLLSEDDKLLMVWEAKVIDKEADARDEREKARQEKKKAKEEARKAEEEAKQKEEAEEEEKEPPVATLKTPINMTNHTYWNLSGD